MATIKNEHQTSPVKTMQLNDQKAGMQGLDKEAINKVIYEASKGTPYFAFQEKRQQRIDKRVKGMLEELNAITNEQRIEAVKKVDALATELESQRDLSRSIVHIDMDAYYAAVEMLNNPKLREKPMAVGSSSMLSTSNYEARKFGVRAAMPGFIAKKLCPELVIIPPHFDNYIRISKQVKHIIKEYDPNYASMSLDEVYLDLTDYILKRHQAQQHSEHCLSECEFSQSSFESDDAENESMLETKAKDVETCRINHGEMHNKCHNCVGPISDQKRDALAYEIVEEIRRKIFEATQLTASAGIAPNTMLAKVCSDQNKPNGQYQIHSNLEEVKSFIASLPVRKVSGIGPVQSQLLNGIGIDTCGDLWTKRDLIALLFTSTSLEFYIEVSMGLGHTTVKRERIRKSIGVEVTFKEIHDPVELHQKCEELCDEMVDDLKSHNMVGKVVVLKIKTVNFDTHTRNSTLPAYTSDKEIIMRAAKRLLDGEINACAPQLLRLRLMGIRMANLLSENEVADERQAKLKDYLKPQTSNQVNENNRTCSVCNANSTQNSVCCCKSISDQTIISRDGIDFQATTEIKNRQEDVSISKAAKINENNLNSAVTQQSEIETASTLTCPVCGIEQKTVELFQFNSHVDSCLSKKAIREILSSEMIVTTTDKRKNLSPKPSNKKIKSEQKKIKKISEYFH